MQHPSFTDDLNFIIESIDFATDGKLYFQGHPYEGAVYPGASADALLAHNLATLLYTACYTRSGFPEPTAPAGIDPDDLFMEELRAANASETGYDGGWTVEEIEHGGSVLVRKGGFKRNTHAGDFIREHFGRGPLQRGEPVSLRTPGSVDADTENDGVFYYVFGKTLLEDNNPAMVRLYFNTTPEGAVRLVSLLFSKFNAYKIPFQFKCLNRRSLYTRCDRAVLYLDKRYFAIATDLLSGAYGDLEPCLNAELPMFVKPLAPGIGFAENPFSPAESFGTHRCKIIAQGMLDAWKNGAKKEAWTDHIFANIRKSFLDPGAIYLNPKSVYPYQFVTFKN
jgi:hypothetical protein